MKRGYAFSILSGLLMQNWYSKDLNYRNAQSDYKSVPIYPAVSGGGNLFFQNYMLTYGRREKLQNAASEVNTAMAAFGIVWLYNVLDAYYFKREESFFNFQLSMNYIHYPEPYGTRMSRLESVYNLNWSFQF